MSNGSFVKWLYSHNYCLHLLQRVSIMLDVALALEYLHHGQSVPVIHCDLKLSNVLLDEGMVAHVGDFGIAKISAENNTAIQTNTLGTFGYIAPVFKNRWHLSDLQQKEKIPVVVRPPGGTPTINPHRSLASMDFSSLLILNSSIDKDKLLKSFILIQAESLPHSRTLVPYPLIPDFDFFGDNLDLAEIISASRPGHVAPRLTRRRHLATCRYGIMLLETFTRKKPTDEMFVGELSRRQWVSSSLRNNIMEAVDGNLYTTVEGERRWTTAMQDNLLAILDLGLGCCQDLPEERSGMEEVVVKLNKIKLQIISNGGAN
ncbi:hypothetical protein ACSBR2_025427 [Camellia fascicularis]